MYPRTNIMYTCKRKVFLITINVSIIKRAPLIVLLGFKGSLHTTMFQNSTDVIRPTHLFKDAPIV